jgi:hypothetical protein
MIDSHGIVYEFFLMSGENEVGSRVKSVAEASAYKSLVVLQVKTVQVFIMNH